jgi:hypothetical protein
VDVVRQHAAWGDEPVPVVRLDVVAAVEQPPTPSISSRFSLRWVVVHEPSTSASRLAQEASRSSVHDSEKRGVTA